MDFFARLFQAIAKWFKFLFRRRPEEQRIHWMLTESDGPANYVFPEPVTEAEALKFLRENYANSRPDFIHFGRGIIFYRVLKPKS